MSLSDTMTANLKFAESHIPQVVTISGTDYAAVVTDVSRGESLAVEGIYSDRAISVTMRTATLACPAIGSQLVYGGRTFRVLAAKDCADGISYELSCDAEHK